MTRLRGFVPRGHKLVAKVPHGKCRMLTFLAALRFDRIDAPAVLDSPINGRSFLAWVGQMLVPTLTPDDIVVMDILGSHKGQAVCRALRAVGAKLLLGPPYSSDLNPIERVLVKLKTLLRKFDERTANFHGIEDNLGPQMIGHRPPHDLAAPRVEHDGEIEKARRCGHVGDVGHPQLVGCGGGEVAIDKVGRGPCFHIASRRDRTAFPVACADQTRLAHPARDALAPMLLSVRLQLRVDAPCPVRVPRGGVHGPRPLQQRHVRDGVRGR